MDDEQLYEEQCRAEEEQLDRDIGSVFEIMRYLSNDSDCQTTVTDTNGDKVVFIRAEQGGDA
jgi:hypothetical protein